MDEDREDKIAKPETEENRGKKGKDTPLKNIPEIDCGRSSGTVIESIRDWPGGVDSFERRPRDD
ncbi:MAG: hypothetical protein ABFD49_01275 [Armatimonadota bacterium]|nr:hypothetical protein [bacterium]